MMNYIIGLNFGAATSTANPLSFGAPATSTSVPTLGGFNFGSNTTTSAAPNMVKYIY